MKTPDRKSEKRQPNLQNHHRRTTGLNHKIEAKRAGTSGKRRRIIGHETEQQHLVYPLQWKSKRQWKSKKNHHGTTTLTTTKLTGIKAGAAKVKVEDVIGGIIHSSKKRKRKKK